MKQTKIKVCGLVTVEDAYALNENGVDYAGFILFYPKSKRHLELSAAKEIMGALDPSIKRVAVMVSPELEQLKAIETAGFDVLQVHGELKEEVRQEVRIPIFRAFNLETEEDCRIETGEGISGYLFDGKIPGNGKGFDWSLVSGFERKDKLFLLAGGLNPDNVVEGIRAVNPDIVDVSSGVEKDNGRGKDKDKIRLFVKRVREIEERN